MVMQLVKRDFIYLCTSLKTTLVVSIIFSLCFPLINVSLGYVAPAMVCYIGFYNVLAYEERNQSNLLNLSLPVARKDICLSKYIQAFLFIIGACTLASVSLLLKPYISPDEVGFYNIGFKESILFMLSIALIYSAIILPCVFYFGTLKSRYVLILLYIIILVGGFGLSEMGWKPVFQFISKICQNGMAYVMISLGIFIVSYMISLGIWSRKEF